MLQKDAGRRAFEQGRYAEAEALDRAALEMVQRMYPADSPEVAGCLNDLAVCYTAPWESTRDAEELYRKALAIWENLPGNETSEATGTE